MAGPLTLMLVMVFFAAGCNFYNAFSSQNLKKAMRGVVIINTVGQTDQGVRERRAIGFGIGNNQIIGLTHAVRIPSIIKRRTPFGYVAMPIKVLSQGHFINKQKLEYVGDKDDIVLLRGKIQGFPFPLGNSSLLNPGDKIFLVGFPYARLICLKTGVISAMHYFDSGIFSKDNIVINAMVNPGDSGAPVLANQNGLKIIGIQAGKLGNDGVGVIYPINRVKKIIIALGGSYESQDNPNTEMYQVQ